MSARAVTDNSAPAKLAARVRAGERVAIAKAISLAEAGGDRSAALLRALHDGAGRANVLGVTGAPGVGKSTLVGALIAELRKRNQSVGVIAVDPSSPISGGAILGDRVRMTHHGDDDKVFIRSLASRGSTGGLSLATTRAAELLDAAGFDTVIIETVGAGQSEIDVADVADLTLVVCAPGQGDDIQAMKAGLLEVADMLVVNKADDPLAAVTAKQLESMLTLRRDARRNVPVIKTAAREAKGIAELVDVISAGFDRLDADSRRDRRRRRLQRLMANTAGGIVARRLKAVQSVKIDDTLTRVAEGELDLESAAAEILKSNVWRDD